MHLCETLFYIFSYFAQFFVHLPLHESKIEKICIFAYVAIVGLYVKKYWSAI